MPTREATGLVTAGPGGRGLTWRVESSQLAGPGVLRAPAPAVRRLVLIELRMLVWPVLGARHGHRPSLPGALRCRLHGRGTAARSRRPMTAQRRARRRHGRGLRQVARHSQSGPAPQPQGPIGGRRAAANRGAGGGVAAGRSWARKRGAGCASRLPCSAPSRPGPGLSGASRRRSPPPPGRIGRCGGRRPGQSLAFLGHSPSSADRVLDPERRAGPGPGVLTEPTVCTDCGPAQCCAPRGG